jgi:F-type H+-transporting ATPase subunit delta
VVTAMSLTATIANFVQLLLDRNRLQFLPQIAESYRAFADELSGVVRPTLTSGLPLDNGQVEAIRQALMAKTGKQVELTVQVDPALIGGVVTQIGDMIYDGSVKTQLNRIEDILQKG